MLKHKRRRLTKWQHQTTRIEFSVKNCNLDLVEVFILKFVHLIDLYTLIDLKKKNLNLPLTRQCSGSRRSSTFEYDYNNNNNCLMSPNIGSPNKTLNGELVRISSTNLTRKYLILILIFSIKIYINNPVYSSSQIRTIDHSLGHSEATTTVNESNLRNNSLKIQSYGYMRSIDSSKSIDCFPYHQQQSYISELRPNHEQKPFNMTKTVKRLVDSLEMDLASKMKRRPSGQFDSCKFQMSNHWVFSSQF